jgi:hypothetical protein
MVGNGITFFLILPPKTAAFYLPGSPGPPGLCTPGLVGLAGGKDGGQPGLGSGDMAGGGRAHGLISG